MNWVYKGAPFRIEGFRPPAKENLIGGYGFSTHLALDVAERLARIELPKNHLLNEIGLRTIKATGVNTSPCPPFEFLNESLLVSHIKLQRCGLYIKSQPLLNPVLFKKNSSHRDILQAVSWSSSNVDNYPQAYTLLSLWITWYETVLPLILKGDSDGKK